MGKVVFEVLESRRLLAFGQLDTSFGGGGHSVTPFPTSTSPPVVQDMQVAGGKILVGGNAGIARYNADGTLDLTFGSSGRIAFSNTKFKSLAVNSSGQVYVLLIGVDNKTLLLRYGSDGQRDTAYGSSGTVVVTALTTYAPTALAGQSDGKVLVAGVVKSSGNIKSRVYRLNADGSGDSGFGSGVLSDFQLAGTSLVAPNFEDSVVGVAVLSSGKILVGGGSKSYAPTSTDPFTGVTTPFSYGPAVIAVARLNSNGTLDSSYGDSGILRATYSDDVKPAPVTAFAARSDGVARVATTTPDKESRLIVGSFSAAGVLTTRTAEIGNEFGKPVDMTIASDGRTFVLGYNAVRPHGLQIALVDPGVDFKNVVYTDDSNPDTNDIASGPSGQIALAADGDLLVAGPPAEPPLGYEIAKVDDGAAGAARPDNFADVRGNDLFRDRFGGLHLAYFDAAAKVLKYAYRAPNGLWNAPIIVDATPNAGQYVSVAADSLGRPGIAYFEGTDGDLKFAYLRGTTWNVETVEFRGSVGLYPSMLFDDSRRPTVVYYKKTGGDLRFAVRDMTTNAWHFETVQSEGDVGRSADLAVDPNTNRFVVAYVDSTKNQVNWARHRPGGKWGYIGAASTKGGADFLSLSYTRNSKIPAIAYYDAANADLRLTSFSGTNWDVRTIATKGAIGLYNELAYDDKSALIYTYDKTNDQMVLVRDGYQGTSSQVIAKGAGRFLNVFSDGFLSDMSFFDTTDQVLKVRGGPTQFIT